MSARRAEFRRRVATLAEDAAELARELQGAEDEVAQAGRTRKRYAKALWAGLSTADQAALRGLLTDGPVTQSRQGHRKDAVLFNPLVDAKLVAVTYGGRTRTWDLTPLGRLVAASGGEADGPHA